MCNICMCQPTSSIQRYEFTWTHREALHYHVDTHTCTHRVYTPNCHVNIIFSEKGVQQPTYASYVSERRAYVVFVCGNRLVLSSAMNLRGRT